MSDATVQSKRQKNAPCDPDDGDERGDCDGTTLVTMLEDQDTASLLFDRLTLSELSSLFCVCKGVSACHTMLRSVPARMNVTMEGVVHDCRYAIAFTPKIVDGGAPHWGVVATFSNEGDPAYEGHTLTIKADGGSLANVSSFLWDRDLSVQFNTLKRVHDTANAAPNAHTLDQELSNFSIARIMYAYSAIDLAFNRPHHAMKITEIVDTKHPRTKYDLSKISMCLAHEKWSDPGVKRENAHILDRPLQENEHPLFVAGAVLSVDTHIMAPSQARTMRKWWSRHDRRPDPLKDMVADTKARDTLASFGFQSVLKREPPIEAEVEALTREVVKDAKTTAISLGTGVEDFFDNPFRRTMLQRFHWKAWININSNIFSKRVV